MKSHLTAHASAVLLLMGIGVGATACGDGQSAKTIAKGSVQLPSSEGQRTIDFDVVKNDEKVSGSVSVKSEQGGRWTLDVQCSVEREGALMIGGAVSKSAGQPPNGARAAAIIRSGNPDRLVMWLEDPPPANSCSAFLAAIPAGTVTDLPAVTGDIDTG